MSGRKPLTVRIQNVVASVTFNQSFDLNAIADAFPWDTEFKGRFPGLVFRLKKPKTTMLIFKTGKMVCTGGKGEDEARKAILTVVRKLKRGGINVAEKPEIKITNIVASGVLNGVIDLDKLYLYDRMGDKIIFEPEQFPAAIYRMKSPNVVFLIFSNGKIVCAGAKKEGEIYEAVENLRRRLEESEVLIRS
jgi:transcription initiation factor TFIID TATA-box-binding protein